MASTGSSQMTFGHAGGAHAMPASGGAPSASNDSSESSGGAQGTSTTFWSQPNSPAPTVVVSPRTDISPRARPSVPSGGGGNLAEAGSMQNDLAQARSMRMSGRRPCLLLVRQMKSCAPVPLFPSLEACPRLANSRPATCRNRHTWVRPRMPVEGAGPHNRTKLSKMSQPLPIGMTFLLCPIVVLELPPGTDRRIQMLPRVEVIPLDWFV
jgi:hypothetical protein